MKSVKASVGLAVLMGMALLGTGAEAASAGARACRKEIEALCPGLTPGDGKFGPCLKSNIAKLSPRCQQALRKRLAAAQKKRKPAAQAVEQSVEKAKEGSDE